MLRQDFLCALLDQLSGEILVTDQPCLAACKSGQTFELGVQPGKTLSLGGRGRAIAGRNNRLYFFAQPIDMQHNPLAQCTLRAIWPRAAPDTTPLTRQVLEASHVRVEAGAFTGQRLAAQITASFGLSGPFGQMEIQLPEARKLIPAPATRSLRCIKHTSVFFALRPATDNHPLERAFSITERERSHGVTLITLRGDSDDLQARVTDMPL
ncbi:hypothetical protein D9M71_610490 [compost metagenome]